MKKSIYQIQIALTGSKPKIWRRVLILSDMSLSDFHTLIQTTMGWYNCHLHKFIHDEVFYTDEDDDMGWGNSINYKKKKIKVSLLLKEVKDKLEYEYDFGDSWSHDIILEKILPYEESFKHPVCIKGKMCCPPEDSGGIWGYYHILEVLKQPDHENYNDYKEWLDDDFDPEYFDIEQINKSLEKL